MSATLTGLRQRLWGLLAEGSTAAWPAAALDEALRAALGEYALASGQAVTISGLDGAETTSLPDLHESLLAWGAAGYAAAARAVQRVGQHDRQPAADLRAWGEERLKEYRAALNGLFAGRAEAARRAAIRASTFPSWGEWSEII